MKPKLDLLLSVFAQQLSVIFLFCMFTEFQGKQLLRTMTASVSVNVVEAHATVLKRTGTVVEQSQVTLQFTPLLHDFSITSLFGLA